MASPSVWKSVLRSALEALLALIVDGESLFGGKPKSMEIETPRRQKHNVITGKYYTRLTRGAGPALAAFRTRGSG